jgi:hypothetical protein
MDAGIAGAAVAFRYLILFNCIVSNLIFQPATEEIPSPCEARDNCHDRTYSVSRLLSRHVVTLRATSA